METKLTIQERLKDLRTEHHLTLEELAAETGLSSSALGSYELDEYKDISHSAIIALANYYDVSSDYLLGITENKEHQNTDLADLHLSDNIIDFLKAGKINRRLFSELATHEDFPKLLADIEIYVDRIASTQIDTLNATVDVARQEILNRYQPAEEDIYLKTLAAAHVEEDEYFSHRIHHDIDNIIRDLREAHKSDTSTGQESTVAEDIAKEIQAAAEFTGSDQERQARIFCMQLGINYDRLSPEEFATLVNILKKSKLLKSPISKRGKTGSKKRKR